MLQAPIMGSATHPGEIAKQTARRRHGPSGIRILIFHHLIKHHA